MAGNEQPDEQHVVVLFDGLCNLCSGVVQWLIARDRTGVFRFASLQSAYAKAVIDGVYGDTGTPDSVMVLHRGRIYEKSDAVLYIAKHLGTPWRWALFAKWMPRTWRDAIYDGVAKHRLHLFGRRQSCLMPTIENRWRWIE
ncbi:thiol-disulfide oxidoreductase DCC family protein [Alicyclobacillus acidiphilus]|uniref:thiol-disulfide oxidoreductase DCC family protein n=1 Tax=Alicyclobacillus acidiphilus TaxID=182455 RepID=UPI000ADB25FB|nr:DCC1-like thiol-disulfide oxidoreductase family protein [Alicyclobacillus acidiphilus]